MAAQRAKEAEKDLRTATNSGIGANLSSQLHMTGSRTP